MPTYKVKYSVLDAESCQTWSTSFYRDESNLDAVVEPANELASMMQKCQARSIQIIKITISQTDAKNKVKTLREKWDTQGFKGSSSTPSFRAIRFLMRSADGYTARFSVKGVPDREISYDTNREEFVIDSELLAHCQLYGDHLQENGWKFRVALRPPDATVSQVQDMAISEDQKRYTITSPGHGLTVNNKVKFQGTSKAKYPALNGQKFIFVVDADTFYVKGGVHCDTPEYEGGLTWYKIVHDYKLISENEVLGIGRHWSGSSELNLRGRRKRPRVC